MTYQELYDLVGSVNIALECDALGVEPLHLAETGCGDRKLTLWKLDGVRVINTNGYPVWEESDPEGFHTLLDEMREAGADV